MVSDIGEVLFFCTYSDLETVFDRSDWMYAFEEKKKSGDVAAAAAAVDGGDGWKRLDVNLLTPRDRVASVIKALAAVGHHLDAKEVFACPKTTIGLKLLFNRVMMFHHEARSSAMTSSGKRKRDA